MEENQFRIEHELAQMILDEENILWWNDYHSLLLKKKDIYCLTEDDETLWYSIRKVSTIDGTWQKCTKHHKLVPSAVLKFGCYVDSVICILIFLNDYNVNEAELCQRLSFISVYLLRMHCKRSRWELKYWMVVSQNCNYFLIACDLA